MLAIQKNPYAFEAASEKLKNDREFVKEIVKNYSLCLRYAPKEFQDDIEIAELALKSFPDSIYYISDRLRKDTEFVSKLIGKRGFNSLPKEFSNDRNCFGIKLVPNNLELATFELQNDRDFILHVVKNCGDELLFVDQQFKSDREIIMTAITQTGDALQYAPNEYFHKEIIIKAAETATPLLYVNYHEKWQKY